jgi:2-deoxy-D-gluconate 3-dehydrogenase
MTLKEFSLEGKAAVVIGAEHAVGRAAGAALAEAGAKVLLASQEPGTEKQLTDAAKAIGSSGAKVSIRVQNASIRGDLSSTVELAVKELGALDILVNALDAPLYAPAEAADDSTFDKVIEGNLKTVWMACQEGGRVMLRRGGGVIVNITSVLADRGAPNAALLRGAGGSVELDARAGAGVGAQRYPCQRD